MKIKMLISVFCLCSLSACTTEKYLFSIEENNGKYGYINIDGNVIITPQFDYAESFSEGLALVKVDEKCGFIDKKGTIVITPQFDYWGTASFSEGLACVKVDGKCGFIDKKGTIVITPQFDYAESFSEGLALVKVDGKCCFIDKKEQSS